MNSLVTLRVLLWSTATALSCLGLVMVVSTTATKGADEALNYGYLLRQAVALGVGVVGAVACSLIGIGALRRAWLVVPAVLVVFVMLALVPHVSPAVNGAHRWFDLGPIKLQPAELAKVAVVVLAAWYLVWVEEKVRVHWHGVLLPLVGFASIALLVYQTRDLGSVVVMAVVLWAILFFAGARWLYTTLLGLGCLPLVGYVAVFQTAYRRERIFAFFDPWNADGPAGYHLRQSYLAIASGGWTGVGLGEGLSKQGFLPERHTDFVYAVICEELGMVGGGAVAVGFLVLALVGLGIAGSAGDRHGRLLAIGATVLLGFQAFWNMMVVTGAVPTKGLTLPFVSYGGTSLVVCWLLVGMLDAVARTADPMRFPALARRHTTHVRLGAVVVTQPARGSFARLFSRSSW